MAEQNATRKSALTAQEIFTTLESEDEDDSGDDFTFDNADSEIDEESFDEPVSGPPAEKRPRGVRPIFPNLEWKDCDRFMPSLFTFNSSRCGLRPGVPVDANSTELEYFLLFFYDNFVVHLVSETNRYFQFVMTSSNVKEKSKLHKWIDTNEKEMLVFLATFMLMSHQKKLRMTDYWSTDALISTPIFGRIMSLDRFLLIMRMLHFNRNEGQIPGNKIYKVEPVIRMLKESYKAVLQPYQNLCIDESLMLWKGRLSFKQYIPSKRHRFGIKLFVLCDVKTGFILDFIVYTGSELGNDGLDETLGKSGSIVLALLQPYLDKGHTLFTDNWYTSPSLTLKLIEHKTGTCGTVKSNRKMMPSTFPKKLKKGDCIEKQADKLLAVKWHDKRDVHMLSSVHKPGVSPTGKTNYLTGEAIVKPNCVIDYNKNMGSVDKTDMQLSVIECVRKSVKWYKKFFFHLLDMTVLNAYNLYKAQTGKKMEFSEFRLKLIRQILEVNHEPKQKPQGGRPSNGETPLRLTERHFPSLVPATINKKNASRKCHVCATSCKSQKKRSESRYMCEKCNVGLCVVPCFEIYHTVNHF